MNDVYSQAQMETMFALDLVSLLLSKYAPRQAEMSMSPFLRQVVPLGSLNAEVVNPPAKSEAAELDIKAVSRGWRLQNFNAAADKLLKSATRLEKEVASETKYWGEVLAVKDKGWKVCRLPGERQALAVQYGFIEGRFSQQIAHRPYVLIAVHSHPHLPRPRSRISTTSG